MEASLGATAMNPKEIAEHMNLPEEEILEVIRLISEGLSDREVAEHFNALHRKEAKPLH